MEEYGDLARPEDTGARLRAVRELAGFSSRDIARAAGISKRELAAAERGKHRLTEDELRSLASALGVDPEVLVTAGLGELDQQTSDAEGIDAFIGHDPGQWHEPPETPGGLPPALPANLADPERGRDVSTRTRVEDSWNDVRSQMDGVIRQCMRVSTIDSGDDVREMIDELEIEIRRLKVSPAFIRGVARHDQIIAQTRSRSNTKSSIAAANGSRVR